MLHPGGDVSGQAGVGNVFGKLLALSLRKVFLRQMIRQRQTITHVTFALPSHRHIDGQYDRLATGCFGALR
jgi:hypothetical protein